MADDDHEDNDTEATGNLSSKFERDETSQFLLPQALFEETVGVETTKDWSRRAGLCLVVKVPTADWAYPIERYLKSLGTWGFRHTRTTRIRSGDDITLAQTVEALSLGERVFGVSQEPSEYLPAAMVMAADATVELLDPTARTVAMVIEKVSGEVPEGLTDAMLAGLGFAELASCIRRNSTAVQCVERLRVAASKKVSIDASVESAPLIPDLHGYGAAKTWALDLIADLEAWRRGELQFDQLDRHAVLEGAPGLGKTQFARSLARSARLPLVATSMSQWFANGPGYLDSVIKQIDASFAAARAVAPAIMLIDELDAVPDRATLSPKNREWWTPVISHILTTLDGAVSGQTAELIILGATNYIERVDDALLRPGRLTRVIKVEHPDQAGIVGILRHHLAGDLAQEDLTAASQLGAGATGAEIMQWVKDARRAARRNGRGLTLADLIRVIAPESERPLDAQRRIAIHEAGHAVVAHFLGIRVEAISLRARGSSSAHVQLDIDEIIYTREEMERVIVQLLAGRAAEQVVLGDPGVGAGGSPDSDLAVSTHHIGRMHLGLGLGGTLIYRADAHAVGTTLDRHPGLAASVEAELQMHYATALDMVRRHEELIELVAAASLKQGHLTGADFVGIVAGGTP